MEELKTQTGPDPLGRGLWMDKVADRPNIMGEKAEDGGTCGNKGLERKGECGVSVQHWTSMLKKDPREDPRLAPRVDLWAACKQEVEIMTELWVAQFGLEIVSQLRAKQPRLGECFSHPCSLFLIH